MTGNAFEAWVTFARDRGLRFAASDDPTADPCSIEGSIEGIHVTLTIRRQREDELETVVRATARHAMLGRIVVRPKRWLDRVFAGELKTGDEVLDEEMTIEASSPALLEAVLDEHTRATLKLLAPKLLHFAYENGAIAIRWQGAEESLDVLSSATGLAAHLAVTGSEVSPYR